MAGRSIGGIGAVLGALLCVGPAAGQAGGDGWVTRVVQTNSAGKEAHVIDPVTRKVVGVIDIPKPHCVTVHPDGTKYYLTNETDQSLDVFDTRTLRLLKQIPVTDTPHNPGISATARKVYVPIINRPVVDVIDAERDVLIRSVQVPGGVHNVFVTPDQRYAVAGMITSRAMSVIDTSTDEVVWTLTFESSRGGGSGMDDGGVRPIAFEANPDGSTKRAFVQISGHHGFYVVDWATRRVVDRISPPPLPLSEQTSDGIQGAPSHGIAVAPDGSQVWISSRLGNRVYGWTLPDLRYKGQVITGSPAWLTITPDSRQLFVAAANTNETLVIDMERMAVVERIPVGQTPKRIQALRIAGPERLAERND
jgi:DNA-binding beta-propeller fold protein YncE